MELGLQSKGRLLKSNTQDTIRRSRNKPKTLRYHAPSPDSQTEEAGCYSPRPNLETNTHDTTLLTRSRGVQLVEANCTASRKVAGSLEFFIDNPSVRGMALGSTRHLHVSIVLKSGSLNFLEPSEPLQVCTWIAFLFYQSSY